MKDREAAGGSLKHMQLAEIWVVFFLALSTSNSISNASAMYINVVVVDTDLFSPVHVSRHGPPILQTQFLWGLGDSCGLGGEPPELECIIVANT